MQPLNQTSLFLSHYISSFHIAFHLLFLLNFAFFCFPTRAHIPNGNLFSNVSILFNDYSGLHFIKDYFKLSKWHQFD